MDHRAWVELGGGALLLIGYRARSAAVVIAAFTLATDFADAAALSGAQGRSAPQYPAVLGRRPVRLLGQFWDSAVVTFRDIK